MENSNQSVSHPAQISPQRYNHQLQPTMWNNKVCQSTSGQNTSLDPYSQQMNQYYQAQYPSQANDMNRYVSKDQNSNPTYSQYPMARQANYSCTVPGQNYQMSVKANCNNMYYANATKNYAPNNVIHSSKKYMNSGLGIPQALPAVPQSSQIARNTGTPMPQMPQYGGDHTNYPMQNVYGSNYNVHTNPENDQSYMLQQAMASPTTALSSQESLIHSVSMVSSNQVSQMSSIPTPPETSSLTGDGLSIVDNTSHDNTADNIKMNVSNSSFALPGSVIGHMPSASSVTNVAAMSHRNTGNSLQPPANLDEGSQASSASASSSIPDEQNSVKASSKPNFSYPPTPNTLSSPGAASMSSFHDDLECISSPGWPKTPASPVANGNYEFANIKRPENLLKLYTLSDEPDRRYFLDKLIVFSEDRGSPLSQCPTISKQPLDVYRVYVTVKERGGFVEVTNAKRWKDIAGAIGVGASSSAAYTLRKQYMKILLPFECKFDRGGIDPQPIINMVEASSRKKGKNIPAGTYGSQSHYSHGYPQSMERYPPGYPGSYQSSRYQCNNTAMDYQCTSNTMHYPQSTSNVPHNSTSGQNQYHQYSHSSSSNYRYYQGSNSATNASYNSNMPNNNENLCRFGRSATSTPVPQEQGYYSPQFPATQTEQNIQDIFGSSRGCSTQENLALPVANQINDIEQLTPYATVNNSVDMLPLKSDNNVLSKSNTDSFGNINMEVSLTGSTSDPTQDNKICFNSNYSIPSKIASVDQSSVGKSFVGPNVPQAYPQSMSENTLNKTPEANYYPDTSTSSPYTNRNQTNYLNQVQTYTNQKLPYQGDYQNKEQLQPNQYTRYSESQNEPYRGSEGPPGLQNDRTRNLPANDGITTKAYQYNCNVPPKANAYAYAPQQGQNKETLSHPVYPSQFSNRPQRAWHPEPNHPYQQVGQRPMLKNQLNSHDGKQLMDNSRPRRSWMPFQNSPTPTQNKNQSIPGSNATLSQSFLQIKAQPLSSSSTPLQSIVKKPFEFPPNTIESIRPVAVKRRRCPAKRLGNIDPWRLMLALKSGLLAECTWALDALSILLADNSTVVYFNLDHLPGLLNVLCDHYRCFLNKIFNLAKDMELEKVKNLDKDLPSDYHNLDSSDSDLFNLEDKTNLLDTTNYTYKTRCNKRVEIEYDEALFLIDPQRSWDIYEDFNASAEHWQKGGGDITSHIQTCFAEDTKRVKFSRELKSDKKEVDVKHTNKNKSNFFKSSLLYKGEPVVVLKKFKLDDEVDKPLDLESEMDTEDSCSIVFSTLDKKVDCSDESIRERDSAGCSDNLHSESNEASIKPNDNSDKTSSIDHMDTQNLAKMNSESSSDNIADLSKNDSKHSIDSIEVLSKSSSEIENSICANGSLSNVSPDKKNYTSCSEDLIATVSEMENSVDIIKENDDSVNSNTDLAKATSEKVITVLSNEAITKANLEKNNFVASKDLTKANSEKDNPAACENLLKSNSEEDKSVISNIDLAEVSSEMENSVICEEHLSKGSSVKDDSVDCEKNLETISEKENSNDSKEDLIKINSETENCVDFIDLTEPPNSESENCVDFIDLTNSSSESECCVDFIDLTEPSFEKDSSVDSIGLTINSEMENSVVSNDHKSISETENSIESIDLTKASSEEDNSVDSLEEPTKSTSESDDSVGINVDLTKAGSEKDNVHSNNSLTETNSDKNNTVNSNDVITKSLEDSQMSSTSDTNQVKLNTKCDIEEPSIIQASEICNGVKESVKPNEETTEKCPQLRGSLSSRKRFLCADLEDEAYSFDEPALCVTSDSQEMLSRRCVCVSTIIRNLSFVPNNDIIMSKNPSVLILLGRLLLLHHEHRPVKNAYQKYETEAYGDYPWEESCTSLKDEPEWWLGTLKVLRDNTLVILSNISGHLDLSPFPEEVSLPILDGLLHWVVCPSSYAQDPLPSRSPSSVLSPQRLCLETLCKLSVLSNNVDLIIATPPWSRIETLFAFLTKNLCSGQDQIMREFALILLSNISQADSAAARTIAEQKCCISYLISFIEEAESKTFQIASSQGTKKLRDKPELMGTTPGMVQRAAHILKNLALVPENRSLFIRYQPRLLSLVMSQVMDQELAAIVADVLFYCSDDMMAELLNYFMS